LRRGAEAVVETALARAKTHFAFADARAKIGRVRAPTVIVHGRDDDVIAWPEAFKLQAAMTAEQNGRLILTGLYGHTAPRGGMIIGPAWRSELGAMTSILDCLVDAPHDPGARFTRAG
jgi:hypothetical protein